MRRLLSILGLLAALVAPSLSELRAAEQFGVALAELAAGDDIEVPWENQLDGPVLTLAPASATPLTTSHLLADGGPTAWPQGWLLAAVSSDAAALLLADLPPPTPPDTPARRRARLQSFQI